MKLYCWFPKGHGQLSFSVMAQDEGSARAAVDAQVEKARHDQGDYSVKGWGTEYYSLAIFGAGEVVEHRND